MKNTGHALINPLKQYGFLKILFEIVNTHIQWLIDSNLLNAQFERGFAFVRLS